MSSPLCIVCSKCRHVYDYPADSAPGAAVACPRCRTMLLAPRREPVDAASLPSDPSETPTLVRQAGEALTETFAPSPTPATGRYVERGLIGRGGMGEVVLCVDRHTRREIALKRMLPDAAADPAHCARFVEEAQVTAQLEHPNIVPVHELDHSPDGTAYFTMKLVKGKSLADIIKEMRAGEPPLGKGGFPRTPSPKPSGPVTQESLERGAGESLSTERLSPGFSLSDLLQVFLKVCDGVAFAHSRGVIHRDLKPANIMVGDFGEVLVMDWGLAKIIEPVGSRQTAVGSEEKTVGSRQTAVGSRQTADGSKPQKRHERAGTADCRVPTADLAPAPIVSDRQETDALRTMAGSMMGTPAYMSPEQAKGELDRIDARSDIWSLGAILYEILTLERAVAGETTYAILANTLKGNIVPPEQRAPNRNIPRELSAIVMKCLSKTRARRYASVIELRRDIALFLEGRSVSASPDTFSQAIVKLVKRNKPVSAAIAAALLVVSVLSVLFVLRLTAERDRAVASESVAVAESKAAKDARDSQRATALAASKRQAQSAVRAASEGRLTEAEARATAAVEVMPDGPWGHYALGVLAHEKKDFATARKHLDEALRLDPAHGPSKLLHTTVLAASGDLAQFEKLAAEADKCTDWKALVAAGDALFAAQRNRYSIAAYKRLLAFGKEAGIPATTLSQVEDKLACAVACEKAQGVWLSIRGLPPEVQKTRIVALLKDIYGGGGCSTREPGTIGIYLGEMHGRVRWLDPLRGLPVSALYCQITDVSDLGPLRGMPLTDLNIDRTRVVDLSPLRGMPLRVLNISATGVTDLRPLEGMQLSTLWCGKTRVSDLRPLRGMPLKELYLNETRVGDLSPLQGMPLRELDCNRTRVSDLSPLKGLALTRLNCHYCQAVADLTPLKGMPLSDLNCGRTQVSDLTPLKGMPLRTLNLFGLMRVRRVDLTPLAGIRLGQFWPPPKEVLAVESLKVVEELEKQGCRVNWTE